MQEHRFIRRWTSWTARRGIVDPIIAGINSGHHILGEVFEGLQGRRIGEGESPGQITKNMAYSWPPCWRNNSTSRRDFSFITQCQA